MKTYKMDTDTAGGGGHIKGEDTTNGGMTTEQMAGMQSLSDEEDSADHATDRRATDRIESNTLGGTAGTGAGPAIGDGEPADTDE